MMQGTAGQPVARTIIAHAVDKIGVHIGRFFSHVVKALPQQFFVKAPNAVINLLLCANQPWSKKLPAQTRPSSLAGNQPCPDTRCHGVSPGVEAPLSQCSCHAKLQPWRIQPCETASHTCRSAFRNVAARPRHLGRKREPNCCRPDHKRPTRFVGHAMNEVFEHAKVLFALVKAMGIVRRVTSSRARRHFQARCTKNRLGPRQSPVAGM